MNPVLHQWKWDFRRIRTLWIVWILVLLASTLGSSAEIAREDTIRTILGLVRFIAIFLYGILLVAQIMYATPFSGSTAFWKTRPLTQTNLFWTKTLLILLIIHLPALLAQVLSWQGQHFGSRFIFWSSLHFGTLTLAIYFLAAVWASLCERFGTFWLCFAGTGGVLAACAIVFQQLSERLDQLPLQPATAVRFSPITSASTMITMALIFLVATLAAWLLTGLGRHRSAALATIGVGVAAAAGTDNLWRSDFLRARLAPPIPQVRLETVVLDQDDQVPTGYRPMWAQVAVKVPPKHAVHPQSWQSRFPSDGQEQEFPVPDQRWIEWATIHEQGLIPYYPDGVRLLSSENPAHPGLISPKLNGTIGTIWGDAPATLFEWRLVVSLPLHPGASGKARPEGIYQIEAARDNTVKFINTTAPRPFGGLSEPSDIPTYQFDEYLAHVIYHAESNTAAVARRRGYGFQSGGPFSGGQRSVTLELDDARWRRLTGLRNLSEGAGHLRLDIYRAVPVATASLAWKRENWTAYSERRLPIPDQEPLPQPSIARRDLPPNPTPAEVDAYLDGILFTWSDRNRDFDWNKAQAALLAIGPAHLDRLLARLPVGEYADGLVHGAIRSLLGEEHKPALLEALQRDPNLAGVVVDRGWQAEAAPILAEWLTRRRVLGYSAEPSAVRVVASQGDPATFDDLRWHFLHSPSGQRDMADALQKCPGFPFEETVAELWERLRYTMYDVRRDQVAGLAARLGDKEALRIALLRFATDERPDELKLLAEAVDHPGGDPLAEWLHTNFEALNFNPQTRKFELK